MIEPAQSTKPTPVINIVDGGDDVIAVDVVYLQELPEACATPKRKHTRGVSRNPTGKRRISPAS